AGVDPALAGIDLGQVAEGRQARLRVLRLAAHGDAALVIRYCAGGVAACVANDRARRADVGLEVVGRSRLDLPDQCVGRHEGGVPVTGDQTNAGLLRADPENLPGRADLLRLAQEAVVD